MRAAIIARVVFIWMCQLRRFMRSAAAKALEPKQVIAVIYAIEKDEAVLLSGVVFGRDNPGISGARRASQYADRSLSSILREP